MTKKSERQPIKAENVAGGAGYILKEELIKGEQLGAYCKMFNEVTLKPGCEIGYHEHHGETETYYLTKGAGIYNDNGKEYPVEVGDVTSVQTEMDMASRMRGKKILCLWRLF